MSYAKLKEIEDWYNKPLDDKIIVAKQIIQDALNQSTKQAVAFSGGKNSLVLLHLVLQFKPDIIVVFCNTGVEYPQNLKFVRKIAKEWNLNFYELKPEKNFWQIVKKYGFPDPRRWYKKEPKCCWYLKNKPANDFYKANNIDCVFVGISAFESRTRKLHIAKKGPLFWAKRVGDTRFKKPILRAYPLAYWTDRDIWQYIELNDLPSNPVYNFVERTGCMVCTGFIGWEKQLSAINPALYRKIMHMMGKTVLADFSSHAQG